MRFWLVNFLLFLFLGFGASPSSHACSHPDLDLALGRLAGRKTEVEGLLRALQSEVVEFARACRAPVCRETSPGLVASLSMKITGAVLGAVQGPFHCVGFLGIHTLGVTFLIPGVYKGCVVVGGLVGAGAGFTVAEAPPRPSEVSVVRPNTSNSFRLSQSRDGRGVIIEIQNNRVQLTGDQVRNEIEIYIGHAHQLHRRFMSDFEEARLRLSSAQRNLESDSYARLIAQMYVNRKAAFEQELAIIEELSGSLRRLCRQPLTSVETRTDRGPRPPEGHQRSETRP